VPTPAELAKAIAAAPPTSWRLFEPFPTSLVPPREHAPPPVRPSEPLEPPPEPPRGELTAVEPEYLPAVPEPPTTVEKAAGGVGFHFDISVSRRRWWWWRLKGSGWAGRLGR
jgi:hypothetical protein